MKRILLLAYTVSFVVMWIAASAVASHAQASAPEKPILPLLQSRLMPGQAVPSGCQVHQIDSEHQYCYVNGITLALSRGEIIRTYLSAYSSGLTVGDLMLNWGKPSGASYHWYTVWLYWPDRYAYVLGLFTPNSRVGMVVYAKSVTASYGPWQGYRNQWR
jgi:hypothetical protein